MLTSDGMIHYFSGSFHGKDEDFVKEYGEIDGVLQMRVSVDRNRKRCRFK